MNTFAPGDHIHGPPGFGYVIVPPSERLLEAHGDDDVFVAWEHGGDCWIASDLIKRSPGEVHGDH